MLRSTRTERSIENCLTPRAKRAYELAGGHEFEFVETREHRNLWFGSFSKHGLLLRVRRPDGFSPWKRQFKPDPEKFPIYYCFETPCVEKPLPGYSTWAKQCILSRRTWHRIFKTPEFASFLILCLRARCPGLPDALAFRVLEFLFS